jgi:SAM-dependent methyltransferase
MTHGSSDVAITYFSDQPLVETFNALTSQLTDGLTRVGIALEPKVGAALGRHDAVLGVVVTWNVGEEIGIRWNSMPWGQSKEATIRILFLKEGRGTRVRWSLEGWTGLFDDSSESLPDWAAGVLLPNVFLRLLPEAVGDWFTDRRARRPGGLRARETYSDPVYHWPNFWLILDRIALKSEDRLLEVGCGGGAFLRKALETGCSATGIDHSPEMVSLARRLNAKAVRSGRLTVKLGDAGQLPVASSEFTCCVSTGAIGFFPDTLAALKEMYRALTPGGRLAVFASTPAMRGTPAAPDPVASRVRFFEGPELAKLAAVAGFSEVRVEMPDLESYARRAGVPEASLPLFRGTGGSLLLMARKSSSVDPVRGR